MPMTNFSTSIYFVNAFQANRLTLREHKPATENSLTAMEFEPSEQTIKNILDFASSYEVYETESTGHIEMNLN